MELNLVVRQISRPAVLTLATHPSFPARCEVSDTRVKKVSTEWAYFDHSPGGSNTSSYNPNLEKLQPFLDVLVDFSVVIHAAVITAKVALAGTYNSTRLTKGQLQVSWQTLLVSLLVPHYLAAQVPRRDKGARREESAIHSLSNASTMVASSGVWSPCTISSLVLPCSYGWPSPGALLLPWTLPSFALR